jgi:hypothetical protein
MPVILMRIFPREKLYMSVRIPFSQTKFVKEIREIFVTKFLLMFQLMLREILRGKLREISLLFLFGTVGNNCFTGRITLYIANVILVQPAMAGSTGND